MMKLIGALALLFLVLGVILFLTRLPPKPRSASRSTLPKPSDDVVALIRSGQNVAAVRAYRKQTGVSLREARGMIARYAE